MDQTLFKVLRGKIDAIERGFALDIYSAADVRDEAQEILNDHPDLPKEERARLDALLAAGEPTRGLIL
jgi:hypothetical protein